MSTVLKAGGGNELQLTVIADGKVVNDYIALRTLIAFDGVDANVKKFGNTQSLYLMTNTTYLNAIGHNDTNGRLGIEAVAIETVDSAQQVGNESGLSRFYNFTGI